MIVIITLASQPEMIFFYGVDAQKRIFVADTDIDIRELKKKSDEIS